MFDFFKKKSRNRNKELDAAIQKIQNNMENNYKDAAQINLKEYEELLREMVQDGKLNDAQRVYYEEQRIAFQTKMKNFTHQDQKPYWT